MRNFILFFEEKEGTSPLVRMLDKFDSISVIHQENDKGSEPFDRHNCGQIPLPELEYCLETLFGEKQIDFEILNTVYKKFAHHPLESSSKKNQFIGFKMRFKAPSANTDSTDFKNTIINILKKNNALVFIAIRQDIFRWALSKYHGDCTGNPGHLQFKLANDKLNPEDIPKINVCPERLASIIEKCEHSHQRKRQMFEELSSAGIDTYPVLYEDFLNNKQQYFTDILAKLEINLSQTEIQSVLQSPEYLKKVHSDNIAGFVENHQEIEQKFGDKFISWS